MRPAVSTDAQRLRGRLALLARVMVGLMLVSGAAVSILASVAVAEAATTTSTTSANAFPVSTSAPSYTGAATVVVNGSLPSPLSESSVSITITDPRNNAIASQNVAVQENSAFTASFQASYDAGWTLTGQYTVTAMAVIPDYVGAMPTSVIYFNYTAVIPTTSTSATTVVTTSSATTSTGTPLSLGSIVPLVLAIVIVVALMGFLLRSRGRRGKKGRASPPAPAPQAAKK
jgi:hypothetical protein